MANPIATAFVRYRPDFSTYEKEQKTGLSKAGKSAVNEGKKHGRLFGATFAKSTAGPFRAIGGIFTKSIVGIGGAFAAIGAVKVFAGFIRDARESNKIARISAQAIRSTGGAAHVTAGQVEALATAISNKTGKDDEAIQSGENLLLTFTNIRNETGKGNDIFNQASQAIVDMTAALNNGEVSSSGLKASSIQLGKALNDPIKGVTALRKVGVSFTKQQTDQIKKLVESGRTLDAQKIILRELGREFGGAAAASTDPMEKLRVIVGNLGERIGNLLLPALTVIASVLANKVIPAVSKFIGPLQQKAAPVIARVAKFVRELIAVVGPILANALVTIGGIVRDQLFPALKQLAQNVGPVLLIIFEDLGGILKTVVLPALKILASVVADKVVPVIATLAKWIKDNREIIPALGIAIGVVLVPAFVAWAVAAGAAAVATIAAAAPVVALVAVIAGAAFLIIKHWKTIKGVFVNVFDWIKKNWPLLLGILTGPIGLAVLAIIKYRDTIVKVFKAGWKAVKDATVTAWHAVRDFILSVVRGFVLKILDGFGKIIHGAATAFGWVKGIGPKLKEAARKFDTFRADVNRALGGIKDQDVNITTGIKLPRGVSVHEVFGKPRHGGAFAEGGILYNAKGNLLSKSEQHIAQVAKPGQWRVWAEDETGGEAYIPLAQKKRRRSTDILRAVAEGFGYQLSPMAAGGIRTHAGFPGRAQSRQFAAWYQQNMRATARTIGRWLHTSANNLLKFAPGLVGALQFARRQVGKPYIWGSAGPNGFDCSGFMSAITNVIRHVLPPYRRVGSTGTFPWPGFAPGTGPFMIGSFRGKPGHMAGTLNGVNVESAGGVGVRVGRSARGALDSMFGGNVWHLKRFDRGGRWPSGTAGVNTSGRTETVVPGGGAIDLTDRTIDKIVTGFIRGASAHSAASARRADLYART